MPTPCAWLAWITQSNKASRILPQYQIIILYITMQYVEVCHNSHRSILPTLLFCLRRRRFRRKNRVLFTSTCCSFLGDNLNQVTLSTEQCSGESSNSARRSLLTHHLQPPGWHMPGSVKNGKAVLCQLFFLTGRWKEEKCSPSRGWEGLSMPQLGDDSANTNVSKENLFREHRLWKAGAQQWMGVSPHRKGMRLLLDVPLPYPTLLGPKQLVVKFQSPITHASHLKRKKKLNNKWMQSVGDYRGETRSIQGADVISWIRKAWI